MTPFFKQRSWLRGLRRSCITHEIEGSNSSHGQLFLLSKNKQMSKFKSVKYKSKSVKYNGKSVKYNVKSVKYNIIFH